MHMFGRRINVELDVRNPKCAAVFRALLDDFSTKTGCPSSTPFLELPKVRNGIDFTYEHTVRAVRNLGEDVVCSNYYGQVIGSVGEAIAPEGMDPWLFGASCSIGELATSIFGFSPGLATALGSGDPYAPTMRSCFVLEKAFASFSDNEKFAGAQEIWGMFGKSCFANFGGG